MVHISTFGVEHWFVKYEDTPDMLDIGETCVASVSINDLVNISEDQAAPPPLNFDTKLTYGPLHGSVALRDNIAAMLNESGPKVLNRDDVLIGHGAIGSNFLFFYTMINPGDHVICMFPTYQQLWSVPESIGAEVSLWKLKKENNYVPDVAELEALLKPETRFIFINNPNNPTGQLIPNSVLEKIVAFAKARNINLLSDETYRPLFHELHGCDDAPLPITAFGYENVVLTGSMSKAHSLAGIRLGWIVSPNKAIIEACGKAREYTSISVSMLDDAVATYTLSPAVRKPLLKRNVALMNENRKIIAEFVARHKDICSWVEPNAGMTVFVEFRKNGELVDDTALCADIIETTGVMLVPGSRCFSQDFKGSVRF